MSAKISGIEIANFRGIEHLELSFLDPKGVATNLVVLAGPNGCGKTSVLEAILIATGNAEQARGRSGNAAVRFNADDYSIRIESTNPTISQQTGKVFELPVRCSSNRSGRLTASVGYFSSWREPKLLGALGITAGKKGKRPSKTEANRLWLLKQFLINTQANEFFAAQSRLRAQKARRPATPFQTGMKKLHDFWHRFYPDQTFSVEPLDRTPDSGFDLFVNHPDGERVSVDDLSSGQLELLQFCTDFIVTDVPLDILLIDEPELHLDPAWHVQIIHAIRELTPTTQLIVSTHSVEIYDAAMSFERHFLVPDDDPRVNFWKPQSDSVVEAG